MKSPESFNQISRETAEDPLTVEAEQRYQEALQHAQELSRRWPALRELRKKDPHFNNATLIEIDSMSKAPVSGMQAWFEYQVKDINTRYSDNPAARSRMMYRLKKDLKHVEELLDIYL